MVHGTINVVRKGLDFAYYYVPHSHYDESKLESHASGTKKHDRKFWMSSHSHSPFLYIRSKYRPMYFAKLLIFRTTDSVLQTINFKHNCHQWCFHNCVRVLIHGNDSRNYWTVILHMNTKYNVYA